MKSVEARQKYARVPLESSVETDKTLEYKLIAGKAPI